MRNTRARRFLGGARKQHGARGLGLRVLGLTLVLVAACLAIGAVSTPVVSMAEEATSTEAAEWKQSLPAELPESWDEAVVAVAQSQVGYQKTEAEGQTRYEAWAGSDAADSSELFVRFCLENAGVVGVPAAEDSAALIQALSAEDVNLYAAASEHSPAAGDLVFMQTDSGETVVGIVEKVEAAEGDAPAQVSVIAGNAEGSVETLTVAADDASVLGYGLLPEQSENSDDVAPMTLDEDVAPLSADNPSFTVQYYAYLPVVKTSADGQLEVIDTSGGILPENGKTPTIKNLNLVDQGNGKYAVDMETTLTEVYRSYDYQFATSNTLENINRLAQNSNYELKGIWVLNDDADPGSVNADDWTRYSSDARFTNNAASANHTTILIQDNTVIRLVYDTTSSGYTNAVNFYDYDITGEPAPGQSFRNTIRQGINSLANYNSGVLGQNDVMLAFGNENTGTGLGSLTWNGNYLNKYNGEGSSNQYGYRGCTFGLVKELDENGNIVYASHVIAPNLFNEGSAIGKTPYDDGQFNLQFNRDGDTYTLTSVGGSSVSGLEYFNHPVCGSTIHSRIWTNNFWPMDGVTGADGKTGAYGNTGKYSGVNGTKNYPVSDDGIAHNNMFGMQYSVQFTLTEDYVGPLEYYFFGDDDMWVFLDGELVCDIGGVHSSVGEYVNLWDYLKKGSSGTHTLSFFYTERGLSGSTCYMQFTLPSVTSATPGQQVGSLTVKKEVAGQAAEVNSDQEFTFTVNLTNAEGEDPNNYSFTRTNADGSIAGTGTVSNDGTFTLRHGQSVVINNLPYGTKFTLTETAVDGCSVTNKVGNGNETASNEATGTISSDAQAVTVTYTNTFNPKLPNTGGMGVFGLMGTGAAIIATTSALWVGRRARAGRHDSVR